MTTQLPDLDLPRICLVNPKGDLLSTVIIEKLSICDDRTYLVEGLKFTDEKLNKHKYWAMMGVPLYNILIGTIVVTSGY